MAAAVSRTGSASTTSGTTTLIAIACLLAPMIDTVAKTYPMKSEPASPKMMRAGLKLYGRNPSAEPASAMTTSATTGFACSTEIAKMNTLEITVTPASSPSRPSMKLMAFIIATYQKTVSRIAAQRGNSIQFVLGFIERIGDAGDDEA